MTSKAGIPSGDFTVQMILDRTKFQEISDILFCRGGKIFVVVEGRRLHCYVTGHMAKLCPGQKPVPQPATLKEVVMKGKPAEGPDGSGEWREVIKKKSKVVAPSPLPQKEKKEHTKKHLEESKCQQQQKKNKEQPKQQEQQQW